MTPQQKAEELLDSIDDIIDLYIPNIDIQDRDVINTFKIEFAYITINNILEIASDYSEEKIVTKSYWKRVKKIIEKYDTTIQSQ